MRRTWTGSYSCSEEEEKGIGYFFSEMRGRAQGARILTIIDGCMKAPLIPKAPSQYGQWLWRVSKRDAWRTSREGPLSKGMPLTALGRELPVAKGCFVSTELRAGGIATRFR